MNKRCVHGHNQHVVDVLEPGSSKVTETHLSASLVRLEPVAGQNGKRKTLHGIHIIRGSDGLIKNRIFTRIGQNVALALDRILSMDRERKRGAKEKIPTLVSNFTHTPRLSTINHFFIAK